MEALGHRRDADPHCRPSHHRAERFRLTGASGRRGDGQDGRNLVMQANDLTQRNGEMGKRGGPGRKDTATSSLLTDYIFVVHAANLRKIISGAWRRSPVESWERATGCSGMRLGPRRATVKIGLNRLRAEVVAQANESSKRRIWACA
jgi:hypothetical protein